MMADKYSRQHLKSFLSLSHSSDLMKLLKSLERDRLKQLSRSCRKYLSASIMSPAESDHNKQRVRASKHYITSIAPQVSPGFIPSSSLPTASHSYHSASVRRDLSDRPAWMRCRVFCSWSTHWKRISTRRTAAVHASTLSCYRLDCTQLAASTHRGQPPSKKKKKKWGSRRTAAWQKIIDPVAERVHAQVKARQGMTCRQPSGCS